MHNQATKIAQFFFQQTLKCTAINAKFIYAFLQYNLLHFFFVHLNALNQPITDKWNDCFRLTRKNNTSIPYTALKLVHNLKSIP